MTEEQREDENSVGMLYTKGVTMFEKEAEEYGEKDLGGKYLSSVVAKDKLHAYKLGQFDGFVAGAEFGYNKANEWHYVKDGDLPKDEDWKWCISYRGYHYVAKYEEMFGCWTNQEYSEVMQPYAWKEIVLPKESE